MIILHSKKGCTYCDKAKEFFNSHSLAYIEKIYHPGNEEYETKKNRLIEQTNWKTFPQIFIGEKFIGGYSELILLFETLKLHEILAEDGITLSVEF